MNSMMAMKNFKILTEIEQISITIIKWRLPGTNGSWHVHLEPLNIQSWKEYEWGTEAHVAIRVS